MLRDVPYVNCLAFNEDGRSDETSFAAAIRAAAKRHPAPRSELFASIQ